jgi:hypothetical protein
LTLDFDVDAHICQNVNSQERKRKSNKKEKIKRGKVENSLPMKA